MVIGIQPQKETSLIGIHRLNQEMGLGEENGQPALIGKIRQAILDYRARPIATGLIEQRVEGWMTIQYIANSTGLPVETIFAEIGLPSTQNANKPLDFLSDEVHYDGGPNALSAAIQKVIDAP